MPKNLDDPELEFFPTIILTATEEASFEEIAQVKKEFDDDVEKLMIQTKDFSEQVMLGKGVIYSNLGDFVSFHDVYGIKDGEEFGSIFLACYPGKKGVEFGIEADVILHLHLFSDIELQKQIEELNQKADKTLSGSYTYFYFNLEEKDFRKCILVPDEVVDERNSLIKENSYFKVLPSKITVEDLAELKRVTQLLLEKMDSSKISKILA